MSDGETTPPTYDRDLQITVEDCSVWSDGRIAIPIDTAREHGLTPGTVVDAQVRFDGGSFPLANAEVTSGGNCRVIRISSRTRKLYGVPAGNGATVDVEVQGVIVDGD